MRPILVVASVAALILASCTTYRPRHVVGPASYALGTRETPAGHRLTYELDIGVARGSASLNVRTEYEEERARLGFRLLEIDKHRAEQRGVRPFIGLLVERVDEGSPAQMAGVLPGDILLALDGRETLYVTHVTEVEERLTGGQPVTARVRRLDEEVDIPLTTTLTTERVRKVERVPLLSPPSHDRAFAGVVLRGIPEDWCQQIWGDRRNAVVLSRVELGSPAYLAGLRAGDIIERVDGLAVPPVEDLARQIAERGRRGEQIAMRVNRGEQESYETTVPLNDYSGDTQVHLPLVFKVEDGVAQDYWSLGPFGLIASNRSTYLSSPTRETKTTSKFSMALGLFQHSTSPDGNRTRLLWFITIDT